MKRISGVALCFLGVAIVSLFGPGELRAEEVSTTDVDVPPPSFERLVELNGSALFGGKVKVDDEQVKITFADSDQFAAGFEGKGIFNAASDEMQGSNSGFLVESTLACGMARRKTRGFWVSRFRLKGETWMDFDFRLPNLVNQQSNFRTIINWNKRRKSGYETEFFRKISVVSKGRPKGGKMTKIKKYHKRLQNWFPRGTAVKVGFGMQDGQCIVEANLGKKSEQMVRTKAKDRGGHIAFAYSRIVFTIDRMVITGTLDREWCEKEMAALKKEGTLIEEDAVAIAAAVAAAEKAKKEAEEAEKEAAKEK